jgi:hypothetical protein
MKRLKILPVDICRILGVSERTARDTLNDIKVHYKKKKHQIICLEELCTYLDIKNPEDIEQIKAEMN